MTAQTTKSIEIDIINNQGLDGCMHGAAIWMARVLKAEESQIILAMDARHIHARATETQRLSIACWQDCLQMQIDWLCESASQFLGEDWNEDITDNLISTADIDEDDGEDVFSDTFHPQHSNYSDAVVLPLPLYLAIQQANQLVLLTLVDQELRLREG